MNTQIILKKPVRLLQYLTLMVLVFACSDNAEDNDKIDTHTQKALLTSHPWQLEKIYIDGVETALGVSDIPFIVIFNNNGILKEISFSKKNEEKWSFKDNNLIIDEEIVKIKKLTAKQFILVSNEKGKTIELWYTQSNTPNSFLSKNIYGKTFYVSKAMYNNEKQDNLRARILIEDKSITITEENLYIKEWELVSDSFFFIHKEQQNNEGLGFLFSLSDDNTLSITTHLEGKNKADYTLTPCKPVNYLSGPDWVLKNVTKNGTETTTFPLKNGTIWYFNLKNKVVEEKLPNETEPSSYMPWDIISNTAESGLKINIVPDKEKPNEKQPFVMLKGTINELELETEIDGANHLLTFTVKKEE